MSTYGRLLLRADYKHTDPFRPFITPSFHETEKLLVTHVLVYYANVGTRTLYVLGSLPSFSSRFITAMYGAGLNVIQKQNLADVPPDGVFLSYMFEIDYHVLTDRFSNGQIAENSIIIGSSRMIAPLTQKLKGDLYYTPFTFELQNAFSMHLKFQGSPFVPFQDRELEERFIGRLVTDSCSIYDHLPSDLISFLGCFCGSILGVHQKKLDFAMLTGLFEFLNWPPPEMITNYNKSTKEYETRVISNFFASSKYSNFIEEESQKSALYEFFERLQHPELAMKIARTAL